MGIPLIAIIGPTASGKSDLSLCLALQFQGEVVNCDSIQIYKFLEKGTSKVPREEQCGIPHHLLVPKSTASFSGNNVFKSLLIDS